MVVSLGWYASHRDQMLDPNAWPRLFNIMNQNNASLGLANYSGLPFIEPLGDVDPCWPLPNTSAGFDQHEWCGPLGALRLPCFARGDCDKGSGNGEGVSFYCGFFCAPRGAHALPRSAAHPIPPSLPLSRRGAHLVLRQGTTVKVVQSIGASPTISPLCSAAATESTGSSRTKWRCFLEMGATCTWTFSALRRRMRVRSRPPEALRTKR
jgi:hypothetical protein